MRIKGSGLKNLSYKDGVIESQISGISTLSDASAAIRNEKTM